MDRIEFRVQPNPESDEHEVRILVNGTDIIPLEMLGLDPRFSREEQSLLDQETLEGSGELFYARSSLGAQGPSKELSVNVSRDDKTVRWRAIRPSEISFTFDLHQYDEAVNYLQTDCSWETPERRAERLIEGLDFGALQIYGIRFVWASMRLHNAPEKFAICMALDEEGEGKYSLLRLFSWAHRDPKKAIEDVTKMIKIPPQEWIDISYSYQNQYSRYHRPVMAGPGWRDRHAA